MEYSCEKCRLVFHSDIQLHRHKEKFCLEVTGPIDNGEQLLDVADQKAVPIDRAKQASELMRRKLTVDKMQNERQRKILQQRRQTERESVDEKDEDIPRKYFDLKKEMRTLSFDGTRGLSAADVYANKFKNEQKMAAMKSNHKDEIKEIREEYKDLMKRNHGINRRLGDLDGERRLRETQQQERKEKLFMEQDRQNRPPNNFQIQLRDHLRQESTRLPQPHSIPSNLFIGNYDENLEAIFGVTRALRKQYIDGGGADPRVLLQLEAVAKEAAALEDSKRLCRQRRRQRAEDKRWAEEQRRALAAVEEENVRLADELSLLRLQHARSGAKDAGPEVIEAELRARDAEHARALADFRSRFEQLRAEARRLGVVGAGEAPAAAPAHQGPAEAQRRRGRAPQSGPVSTIIYGDGVTPR